MFTVLCTNAVAWKGYAPGECKWVFIDAVLQKNGTIRTRLATDTRHVLPDNRSAWDIHAVLWDGRYRPTVQTIAAYRRADPGIFTGWRCTRRTAKATPADGR